MDTSTRGAALKWTVRAQEDRAAQRQAPGMWDSVPRVTVALLVQVLHLAPGTGLRHISSDTVFNGQLRALGGAAD